MMNIWKTTIPKNSQNPVSQYRLELIVMIRKAIKSGSCTVNNNNKLTALLNEIMNP